MENRVLPPPSSRRIVCAALRLGKDIVLGPRHFDTTMIRQIAARNPFGHEPWREAEQGFIDQHGAFLGREEAFLVAAAAGQIQQQVGGDAGRLFSENLY